MIPATEALELANAKLTPQELEAADKLEAELDEFIRTKMERRGCDFTTKETNGNVIAEINQRIKRAGYAPTWHQLIERNRFNAAAEPKLVGYKVQVAPSDEAYRESNRISLS
jgi:hypothetical protein